MRYEYDAPLHELPDNGGAYVVFPWDLRKEPGKGRMYPLQRLFHR